MKLRIAQAFCALLVMTGIPLALQAATQPTVSPLAGPIKAEHDAHAALDKARAQLLAIRKRIAVGFDAKPEWKSAKDELDQAKTAFDAADKKLVSTLDQNPDYKALAVKRDKAQAIVDASLVPAAPTADDTTKLTEEDIANARRDRIEAASALKKIQKEAESNDPAYLAAKQRYSEARQAWDALQSQLDDAVKADPEYKPDMQAIDQAEAAWKSARDALAAASRNAHPAPHKH